MFGNSFWSLRARWYFVAGFNLAIPFFCVSAVEVNKPMVVFRLTVRWVTSKFWQYCCGATVLKPNTKRCGERSPTQTTDCLRGRDGWMLIDKKERTDWEKKIELQLAFVHNILLIMNDSAASRSTWAYQRIVLGAIFGTEKSQFLGCFFFWSH